MLDALFVGNFISAFQGKGIEFYDFREYHYGDDAKLIDWAVSSREGKTIVRRYIQERDMNVLFLIDENEQISFSPVKEKLKEELVFLFGNAALVSGASVGSLRMFQDEIEYIAPQKQEFVLYKMLQKSSKKERNTEILDIP